MVRVIWTVYILAFLIPGKYLQSIVLGEGRLEQFRAVVRNELWEALSEPDKKKHTAKR